MLCADLSGLIWLAIVIAVIFMLDWNLGIIVVVFFAFLFSLIFTLVALTPGFRTKNVDYTEILKVKDFYWTGHRYMGFSRRGIFDKPVAHYAYGKWFVNKKVLFKIYYQPSRLGKKPRSRKTWVVVGSWEYDRHMEKLKVQPAEELGLPRAKPDPRRQKRTGSPAGKTIKALCFIFAYPLAAVLSIFGFGCINYGTTENILYGIIFTFLFFSGASAIFRKMTKLMAKHQSLAPDGLSNKQKKNCWIKIASLILAYPLLLALGFLGIFGTFSGLSSKDVLSTVFSIQLLLLFAILHKAITKLRKWDSSWFFAEEHPKMESAYTQASETHAEGKSAPPSSHFSSNSISEEMDAASDLSIKTPWDCDLSEDTRQTQNPWSILMDGASRGHNGRCNGDCENCPPHYGYRYGRWYYGHHHRHGCEFGGNKGL